MPLPVRRLPYSAYSSKLLTWSFGPKLLTRVMLSKTLKTKTTKYVTIISTNFYRIRIQTPEVKLIQLLPFNELLGWGWRRCKHGKKNCVIELWAYIEMLRLKLNTTGEWQRSYSHACFDLFWVAIQCFALIGNKVSHFSIILCVLVFSCRLKICKEYLTHPVKGLCFVFSS